MCLPFLTRFFQQLWGGKAKSPQEVVVAIFNRMDGLYWGGVTGSDGKYSYSGYILKAQLKMFADKKNNASCGRQRKRSVGKTRLSVWASRQIKLWVSLGEDVFWHRISGIQFQPCCIYRYKSIWKCYLSVIHEEFELRKNEISSKEKKYKILSNANNGGRKAKITCYLLSVSIWNLVTEEGH